MKNLLLFSLHDFVFQEQPVLCIPTNGMQFIPFHQIINILAAAFKNSAGFTDTDDPVLNKSNKIIQRERYCLTVFIEFTIRKHSPFAPHYPVTIRLNFNTGETFFVHQIRFTVRVCFRQQFYIGYPDFSVSEEYEQPTFFKRYDILNLCFPAFCQ